MINTLKNIWNGMDGFLLVGIVGFGLFNEYLGKYDAAMCDYLFAIAISVVDSNIKTKLK